MTGVCRWETGLKPFPCDTPSWSTGAEVSMVILAMDFCAGLGRHKPFCFSSRGTCLEARQAHTIGPPLTPLGLRGGRAASIFFFAIAARWSCSTQNTRWHQSMPICRYMTGVCRGETGLEPFPCDTPSWSTGAEVSMVILTWTSAPGLGRRKPFCFSRGTCLEARQAHTMGTPPYPPRPGRGESRFNFIFRYRRSLVLLHAKHAVASEQAYLSLHDWRMSWGNRARAVSV